MIPEVPRPSINVFVAKLVSSPCVIRPSETALLPERNTKYRAPDAEANMKPMKAPFAIETDRPSREISACSSP